MHRAKKQSNIGTNLARGGPDLREKGCGGIDPCAVYWAGFLSHPRTSQSTRGADEDEGEDRRINHGARFRLGSDGRQDVLRLPDETGTRRLWSGCLCEIGFRLPTRTPSCLLLGGAGEKRKATRITTRRRTPRNTSIHAPATPREGRGAPPFEVIESERVCGLYRRIGTRLVALCPGRPSPARPGISGGSAERPFFFCNRCHHCSRNHQ